MREPRAQAPSYPAYLEERRPLLAARLASATPTEAMHTLRDTLDELGTLDLSARTTRERQVSERAIRIARDVVGMLGAVMAEPRWPAASPSAPSAGGRSWRVVALVAGQLALTVALIVVLVGLFQQPAPPPNGQASGQAGLLAALALAGGLVLVQGFTVARLLAAGRARPLAALPRPEVALRVDGERVMAALGQALVAVDQLERAAEAPPEPAQSAARQPAGLAQYPELLRAVQQVYAAHLTGDAGRALQRAEGLRAALEAHGVTVHDAWVAADPPPSELFVVQRGLDPDATGYRVILPALSDATGVLAPGRLAAPLREAAR